MGHRVGADLDPRRVQREQLLLRHVPGAAAAPRVRLADEAGGDVNGRGDTRLPQDREQHAVVVLEAVVEGEGREPGRRRSAGGAVGQLGHGDQLEARVEEQPELSAEAGRGHAQVLRVRPGGHVVHAVVAHVHRAPAAEGVQHAAPGGRHAAPPTDPIRRRIGRVAAPPARRSEASGSSLAHIAPACARPPRTSAMGCPCRAAYTSPSSHRNRRPAGTRRAA